MGQYLSHRGDCQEKIILVYTVILKSSTLISHLFVFAFLVVHSGNERHSHFLVSIQMN